MSAAWGIDLGTTNSVIARLHNGVPTAVPVGDQFIVPSVVLFEDERVIVGREARNLELSKPERVVRSAKRRMGEPHRYDVGARQVTPEEVAAEVLRALKEGAEVQSGEAVTDVVITVPAYFDDGQRRATLRAGELAGLNVLRLLNEPTAASLVYEQALGERLDHGPEMLLVYDLGGGTFDVSVLEVFEGVREVRATHGNSRLGGDDFDEMLLRLFLDRLRAEHGVDVREDPRAMARLRRAAEETKIKLSSELKVAVREEFIAGKEGEPIHLDLEVRRRDLEELIEPLLISTIELARKAVEGAGLEVADIDRVCLVGGTTRIPLVRQLLEKAFGAEVHEEVDPDLAVGLGAAVQSGLLQGQEVARILVDVASHTLGVRVLGDLDRDVVVAGEPDTFAPILRRYTALPARRSEEFYTLFDDQEKIEVKVFQGEAPRCSENTPVGSFFCPLEPSPAHTAVRIDFAYDLSGVVRVSVRQEGATSEKSVALALPGASVHGARAPEEGAEPVATSAIERRAELLLEDLESGRRGELQLLLERYRSARGEGRAQAEDALLDFFFEVEDAA
jgi:molecular chaperone DnaK